METEFIVRETITVEVQFTLEHATKAQMGSRDVALLFLLTLSIRAEYTYSAASHASCPDGVLKLRDFHKVLK
jgi:hypothetical protein